MMSGQLPPRKIAPRTISPWMIAPGQLRLGLIAPEKNCTLNNGSRGKLPPDNFPRGKLPPENCLLTIKFPLKIIAPTQANSAKEYYE